MTVFDLRQAAGAAVAVVTASSLVGCSVLVPGSSSGSSWNYRGVAEQVRFAVPGEQWVERGDEPFAAAMNEWSDTGMSPGAVAQRSYLVRNMDARPGTWTVALGDPVVSENAYFAVGVETGVVGATEAATAPVLAQVPGAPGSVPPGAGDAHWLAGAETAAREQIIPATGGEVLASVPLDSCGVAVVTDWVVFPDVSDSYYQQASARPNIQVTFTPEGGDPGEYVPGECTDLGSSSGSSDYRILYLFPVIAAVLVALAAWFHLEKPDQLTR